jgi:holo-[acyl-carrier protein] synthase
MIFGIGIDVLEAARIKKTLARFGEHFVDRLLMPAERAQLARTKRPERFIAMRFAAKEAIVKAMGTGFAHASGFATWASCKTRGANLKWRIRRAARRCGAELGIGCGHVTLTDEAGLIVAVAVLETAPPAKKEAQANDEAHDQGAPPMNTLVFDIETVPDVEFGPPPVRARRVVRRRGRQGHAGSRPTGIGQ